ncbi:tRNA acetyltransferase TAN1 [Geosmithia morbida]|uniref:tRNA acetyltransferase TAN1 n=1 Tax=Geosmithia morbida TaxID=1094350 RepID=A0A9P4YTV3_9HYPO|nr:tRNA acetyltransferase TAN1 [Geosmithia morbida]KAF4121556.1 tRNA acetyltransferase TAN1 [Geosmithia morbida]
MGDVKRKQGPGGDRGSGPKRSKGGGGGKWRTPHQQAKLGERTAMGKTLEIGDQGMWVTFARGMKGKAIRELNELCEEYGEKLYGIKRTSGDDDAAVDEDEGGEGGGGGDIEASIAREMDEMKREKEKPKTRKIFTIIPADVECLLFVKTMAPVDPKHLVREICRDAGACRDILKRKTRYINRLTPVEKMDKASENGILKVARAVIGDHLGLVEGDDAASDADSTAAAKTRHDGEAYTYAIRPTARNHSTFKSGDIIKKIAGLVKPEHKVNLGKPDKVIIVEIYQMFCGVSVVEGDEWESFKRFNVNELYRIASEEANREDKSVGKSVEKSADEEVNGKVLDGEST